jgi:hypothetical protein
MAEFAHALPVGLVPEQDRIATVRHEVVDHRRGLETASLLARHTQRVAGEVRGPGPAPTGTVASPCRARPLAVQRPLHLRRAAHPRRTVHGRLRRQRRLHKAKPAAAVPGGCRDTLFELAQILDLAMDNVKMQARPELRLETYGSNRRQALSWYSKYRTTRRPS